MTKCARSRWNESATLHFQKTILMKIQQNKTQNTLVEIPPLRQKTEKLIELLTTLLSKEFCKSISNR